MSKPAEIAGYAGPQRIGDGLSHEWHVAINRHMDERRAANKDWDEARFMYEAKTLADEIPRMVMLFRREREDALPKSHQQCSMQAPVPIKDNHLTCCLGVKTRECPYLLALEKIERRTPEEVDVTKAWTCGTHIVSKGGDHANEGYLLTVSDRMFWSNVYQSLAQDDPDLPSAPMNQPSGES